jgi:four helix bundle protein
MAPPRDLIERTRLFSLAVVACCRLLPKTAEAQEMAGQLRRAANSVRMNYRAARRARSRAEFRAKLGTVFEEADACADALRYFRDTNIRHDPELVNEAEELTRIFAAAVRTTREHPRRPKERPPTGSDTSDDADTP